MGALIVNLGYFVAAIVFIYALKSMSHPSTARKGIHYAGIAMILAVVITLFHPDIVHKSYFTNIILIVIAIAIGFFIAKRSALKVEMTDMPQMIAIYNGVGGGAAAIIGAIA
ncbi:MAG TPA: NAD(P)(+) transhydrogenase (Re/Si-specific) subunit beta, partial [Candidatus Ignatzschineria merdigallinarum]|nr:NAD(P)(+) transhydrogenase (Re/Si-specific) subunit beta [Candidatus Ignatzschineria merdigallinarum]